MTFQVYVDNEEFDNDDNEYGKFKFHNYINMDNSTDLDGTAGLRDEEIKLVECKDKVADDDSVWQSSKIKNYCPDFGDTDFLYGDYYTSKYSWMRLSMHFCDIRERQKIGKTCKSIEESEAFFENNIVGMDLLS